MMIDGYVADLINNDIMEQMNLKIPHKQYDTSNVKVITLNGKKYVDISVIEDIRKEIEDDYHITSYKQCLEVIDRKLNEVTNNDENR